MKLIIFIITFACCSFSLFGQFKVEKSPIVITINKDVISKCKDTVKPCANVSINRIKDQQAIVLLPLNGTSSSVILYDLKQYSKYKNDKILPEFELRSDKKFLGQGQPLTLNLTYLKDGDYLAVYQTGECFAIVEITLLTK